jgi:hypothetical protein
MGTPVILWGSSTSIPRRARNLPTAGAGSGTTAGARAMDLKLKLGTIALGRENKAATGALWGAKDASV